MADAELLSQAATALGVPEPIVQRSAAARATANGVDVDEVLRAWAGGGSVAAAEDGAAPAEAAPAEATRGRASRGCGRDGRRKQKTEGEPAEVTSLR